VFRFLARWSSRLSSVVSSDDRNTWDGVPNSSPWILFQTDEQLISVPDILPLAKPPDKVGLAAIHGTAPGLVTFSV